MNTQKIIESIDNCIIEYLKGDIQPFEDLVDSLDDIIIYNKKKFINLHRRKKISLLTSLNELLINKKYSLEKSKKLTSSELEFFSDITNSDIAKNEAFNNIKSGLNNSTSKHKIKLCFEDPIFDITSDFRYLDIEMEAYHISSFEWNNLLEYNKMGPFENSREYKFSLIDNIYDANLVLPRCLCPLCSSSETVRGNYIDDNCDIWGTQYGYKSRFLYLVYVYDINKYGLVEGSYFYI